MLYGIVHVHCTPKVLPSFDAVDVCLSQTKALSQTIQENVFEGHFSLFFSSCLARIEKMLTRLMKSVKYRLLAVDALLLHRGKGSESDLRIFSYAQRVESMFDSLTLGVGHPYEN